MVLVSTPTDKGKILERTRFSLILYEKVFILTFRSETP